MKKNLIYLGKNIPTDIIRRLFTEANGDFTIIEGASTPSEAGVWDSVAAIGDFEEVPPCHFHVPASEQVVHQLVKGLAIDRELPLDWEQVQMPGLWGMAGILTEEDLESGERAWVVAVGVSPDTQPQTTFFRGRIQCSIPLHGGWFRVPAWVVAEMR